MNVSKLITPQQKIVAGFILIAVLVGLFYLLPPLVLIFKNLWMLAFYIVVPNLL